MAKKRTNPNKIPVKMSKADLDKMIQKVYRTATVDTYTVLFTVLCDKEGYDLKNIQRVYDETGDLMDSVCQKRISLADMRHVLKEEYNIELERLVGVM